MDKARVAPSISMLTKKLTELGAEILGVPSTLITPESTPDSLDSWNSLNHLRLITAVEEFYDIQISMRQIQEIESFGDLNDVLLEYLVNDADS